MHVTLCAQRTSQRPELTLHSIRKGRTRAVTVVATRRRTGVRDVKANASKGARGNAPRTGHAPGTCLPVSRNQPEHAARAGASTHLTARRSPPGRETQGQRLPHDGNLHMVHTKRSHRAPGAAVLPRNRTHCCGSVLIALPPPTPPGGYEFCRRCEDVDTNPWSSCTTSKSHV